MQGNFFGGEGGGWEVVMQFYTALNNILNFHQFAGKTVKMLKEASNKVNFMYM